MCGRSASSEIIVEPEDPSRSVVNFADDRDTNLATGSTILGMIRPGARNHLRSEGTVGRAFGRGFLDMVNRQEYAPT